MVQLPPSKGPFECLTQASIIDSLLYALKSFGCYLNVDSNDFVRRQGMGHFPIVPVKRHEDKVPDMVRARGGYMIVCLRNFLTSMFC